MKNVFPYGMWLAPLAATLISFYNGVGEKRWEVQTLVSIPAAAGYVSGTVCLTQQDRKF
jgi:hypothetical protein